MKALLLSRFDRESMAKRLDNLPHRQWCVFNIIAAWAPALIGAAVMVAILPFVSFRKSDNHVAFMCFTPVMCVMCALTATFCAILWRTRRQMALNRVLFYIISPLGGMMTVNLVYSMYIEM